MTARRWSRFVALGDSIAEGMCDSSRQPEGEYRGWADRLAMMLAQATPDAPEPLRFANLALRSSRSEHVWLDQLPRALTLEPDLVSLLVGGNDLARHGSDPVAVAARVDECVSRIRDTGADVLLSTHFEPQFAYLKPLKHRAARYNDLLRAISEHRSTLLLDFWTFEEFQDVRMWAEDRVHLSSRGHRALAYRAAETLQVSDAAALGSLDARLHDDEPFDDPRTGNVSWVVHHAVPWLTRRARGIHAGDGRTAKHSALMVVSADGFTPSQPSPSPLPSAQKSTVQTS